VAIVDADIAERVSAVQWAAARTNKTTYAVTYSKRIGKSQRRMHRMVMNCRPGQIVDHINGNGLDNRRSNLRVGNDHQNCQNQFIHERIEKTSRYKGVHLHSGSNRWIARIKNCGNAVHLGTFEREIEAALAYDQAALALFGEYARTNEMMGLYPHQDVAERNALGVSGPQIETPRDTKASDDGRIWLDEKFTRVNLFSFDVRFRNHRLTKAALQRARADN